ncbi:MaoC family dehydratase [Burkholderia ambifaria]|uniref:MaoC family dehydratase n=1 Tax=Burkholderia ambifaria TaxID=152480 RepID=UPI001FC7D3A7|nr:MaoC family dehydratase [Burkholderia ambifaria]WDR88458.1 MaoC family dehydratase [Burkholderia ambifaria]WDS01209.1 MaoC family dehydratase [Burkholderia ambifaria]
MNSSYKVGESTSQLVTFDVDSVRQFATLAGDMSPLHHDEAFAKTTRFGGLIVSGTHYSAMMMGMVATFLTERRAGLGLEFEFQFRKAVAVGKPSGWNGTLWQSKPTPSSKVTLLRSKVRWSTRTGTFAFSPNREASACRRNHSPRSSILPGPGNTAVTQNVLPRDSTAIVHPPP